MLLLLVVIIILIEIVGIFSETILEDLLPFLDVCLDLATWVAVVKVYIIIVEDILSVIFISMWLGSIVMISMRF